MRPMLWAVALEERDERALLMGLAAYLAYGDALGTRLHRGAHPDLALQPDPFPPDRMGRADVSPPRAQALAAQAPDRELPPAPHPLRSHRVVRRSPGTPARASGRDRRSDGRAAEHRAAHRHELLH